MNAELESILNKLKVHWTDPDRHPDIKELLAYTQNRLSFDQREPLLDHLSQCRHCGDVLLALKSELRPTDPSLIQNLDPEMEKGWAGLEQMLSNPKSDNLEKATGIEKPDWWRRASTGFALAATFFLMCCIVSWKLYMVVRSSTGDESITLASHSEKNAMPSVNTPILILEPLSDIDSLRAEGEVKVLDRGKGLVLQLETDRFENFSAYEITIQDGQKQSIWRGGGLERRPDGSFSLVIPSGFLPPGKFHLTTYGIREDEPIELEKYLLEIIGEPER